MVSETSWAVPWRGNAAIYGNDDNVVGKIARFQLGSAEIASAISSGYDADDDKVGVAVKSSGRRLSVKFQVGV